MGPFVAGVLLCLGPLVIGPFVMGHFVMRPFVMCPLVMAPYVGVMLIQYKETFQCPQGPKCPFTEFPLGL
jgi:hypothetical protein